MTPLGEVYPLEKDSPWLPEIFAFQEAQLTGVLSWTKRYDGRAGGTKKA